MLNIFYWYVAVWGIVFSLYLLGWSDFCTELSPDTTIFFSLSIVVSAVLGVIFRKKFIYSKLRSKVKRTSALTITIFAVGMADLIYAHDIPLISIIRGLTAYTDFKGITLIHTLLENIIIFYSSYLFYIFLETRNKKILLEIASMLMFLLLMFHKGALLFCIFCMVNLSVAKMRSYGRKLKTKQILFLALVVFLILYVNGGLSNIRTGGTWNDVELAAGIGRINDHWPSFIPYQFTWAYSYIISPMANLNLNITYGYHQNSIVGLVASILPQTFVKLALPHFAYNRDDIILFTPAMNACTGFIESVNAYGLFGLWFFYLMFMIIQMILISICKRLKTRCAYYNIMCMMTFILFFYNSLRTAATSFFVFYIIIVCMLSS